MQYQKQYLAEYGLTREDFMRMWRAARSLVTEVVDLDTAEVSPTELAEAVAAELDKWEWLDDETHPLWELAVEVASRD
jgi:hypothetical protein